MTRKGGAGRRPRGRSRGRAAAADALWLVIDQGGQSSRAVAYDHRGEIVALARVRTRESRRGERVEIAAERLWQSVQQSVRAVRRLLGRRAARVRAVALATQRSSIVCWDRRSGRALTPVMSWQDRRNAGWLAAFNSLAAPVEARTGLRLSPHYGVSKLRWCLDHAHAVRRARHGGWLVLGPLASYLLFRLTARRSCVVDPANAARTLLYDPLRVNWDDDLLSLFWIDRALLPRCVPTRHAYGDMSWHEGALPVRIVSGDQSCALFGYGEPDPHIVYVNMGTGAFVQRLTIRPPADRAGLLTSVVYSDGEDAMRVLEGTVNGAAAAIQGAARTLGVRMPFARIGTWLREKHEPPLFLNAVSGLGSPYWRTDIDSAFHGRGSPRDKLVAVAESVVFLIQVNIEIMDRLAGPAREIVVSGGLAGIDALCQRLADLSSRCVRRPAEREATARGAAFLLAGRPSGWARTEGDMFTPRSDSALWARYASWQEALDRRLQR
ncbi:MAG: FGGY family carbohydrate kinase [Chromatiales bacterium]